MADVPELKAAFAAGADIHAATAQELFGHVDRETRGRAKTINFAILYGISRWGLAPRLGVTPEEAQGMIDTYFQRFPGIQRYIHDTLSSVREKGYSRPCSAANAGSRASVRRIRPSARAANAPRSTPRFRAPAPTSSSAPWPRWNRRWPRRACRA
jgi:DNA polymerase-1